MVWPVPHGSRQRFGKSPKVDRGASTHESRADEILIRSTAIAQKISHATNLAAAEASVKGMRSLKTLEFTVKSIQEYHA